MESLWLVGLLLAIVLIGYAVVNVVFKLVNDTLTFIEENRLRIIIVLAILYWRSFWHCGSVFIPDDRTLASRAIADGQLSKSPCTTAGPIALLIARMTNRGIDHADQQAGVPVHGDKTRSRCHILKDSSWPA